MVYFTVKVTDALKRGRNMNKLDRTYRLRTSDFDRYHKILPATLLDMFQDMAGEHADYIGIGYDGMHENNLFWILLRVKYEVIRMPKLYTDITASTWPHEPKKGFFVPDYVISDADGNELVIGSSQWGIADLTTRRLVAPKNVKYDIDEYYPKCNFDYELKKLKDFEITDDLVPYEIISGYTDIDVNGHVNNIKYANYVINAIELGKDEIIKDFQIDYRKEVKEGEKLLVYHVREGNNICCKGCDLDGQVRFVTGITVSNS